MAGTERWLDPKVVTKAEFADWTPDEDLMRQRLACRCPLAPRLNYDTVEDFSQAVVQHLAKVIPSRFVAKSGPSNRIGKLFVDYLRNGHGATTAAAFSARARPGLGVSMPVAWDNLPQLKSGAQWTISTAREYLSFETQGPWAEYWRTRKTLTAAMKSLGLVKKPGNPR